MNQDAFELQQKDRWQTYTDLLERISESRKKRDLEVSEMFLVAYRSLCRDLATAQTRGYSNDLIDRLNSLVLAGHNIVHVHRRDYVREILYFILGGFAVEVRKCGKFVLVATLFFLVPGVVVSVLASMDPQFATAIIPAESLAQIESMYDPSDERFSERRDASQNFMMFGFYIYKNVGIALRTFALGVLGCFFGAFILVMNGMFIGMAAFHTYSVGYYEPFTLFVISHGAFELPALVLAAVAGFHIGYRFLVPGDLRPFAAAKKASVPALKILLGSVLMLFMAAFVEAFWSSNFAIASWLKYSVGGTVWVLVLAYFLLAGRRAT